MREKKQHSITLRTFSSTSPLPFSILQLPPPRSKTCHNPLPPPFILHYIQNNTPAQPYRITFFFFLLIFEKNKAQRPASGVRTVRLRQHIYVRPRHRIPLEEQTQRRHEDAEAKRNDPGAPPAGHQGGDLNTTSQGHSYQTGSELLRLRKGCFTEASRNPLEAKFSIKGWRLIFRSKPWRSPYAR